MSRVSPSEASSSFISPADSLPNKSPSSASGTTKASGATNASVIQPRIQIDLQTRRVQIGGVVRQAYGAWMTQGAHNLTDGMDRFLIDKRYLLHDRDPLFTDEFRGVLAAARVRCLRLPAHSPNLNSVAERFVLSIKSECLSKLVPLGESHLWRAVSEYIEHYHRERNHQGVGNRLLTPAEQAVRPANGNAPVERRERLGGLLNSYHRRAA